MKKVNKKILRFFSALSDETRLKIVSCLKESPSTVSQIHRCVGDNMTLSAVSHQLRLLTDLDIVDYKKSGREKTFRLSDEFCWCILKDAEKHFSGKCKKCHSKNQ
jgi:ArsR family transcriptional regulator